MKILIINEYDQYGGTEVQIRREYDYLVKQGVDVYLLFFKKNTNTYEKNNNVFYYDSKFVNSFGRFITSIFPDIRLYFFLKRKINKLEPDFIHVHNIYYSPKTVYKTVRKYLSIQTIRDYSAVCPKGTLCKKNWEVCDKSYGWSCLNCIFEEKTLRERFKIAYKLVKLIKVNSWRRNGINKMISPSRQLADRCKRVGLDTKAVNNPFDLSLINNFIKDKGKGTFLYVGNVAEYKGVYQMIDAFIEFSKTRTCKLKVVGNIETVDEVRLKRMIPSNVCLCGVMKYEDVLKEMDEAYCLIVPSLWMENYANVILEGFARGCIVVASNRGGAVEQVVKAKLLFDVLDKDDFVSRLNYVYDLTDNEIREIQNIQISYLLDNNNIDKYYNEIFNIEEGGYVSDKMDKKKKACLNPKI